MALSSGINFINYVEHLVGDGHATLSDTLNRALKELMTKFDEGSADTQVPRNSIKIASSTNITVGVVTDDAVYFDTNTNKWIKASNQVDGIIDVENLIVYTFGPLETSLTLTPGSEYYVDSTTPGALTTDSNKGPLVGRAFTSSLIFNVTNGGLGAKGGQLLGEAPVKSIMFTSQTTSENLVLPTGQNGLIVDSLTVEDTGSIEIQGNAVLVTV